MKRTRPAPVLLLRWTFRSGSDFLTCSLERQQDATYALRVIPHGDRREASVEIIDSAVRAYQRHGLTAARLREFGWELIDYTRPATNVKDKAA
jgi:hypothetical protein